MTMQKHFDAPGSSAWHARRAACFNAADAAAALGCSPYKTRTQLLDELATGVQREHSDYVQERILDRGHRIEEQMRPIGEEIMGEELYVFGGSLPVAGLSRPLGASFDGSTLLEDANWECKSLNAEIRAALPHDGRASAEFNDAAALPKLYRVQLEQQTIVNGAERALFSAGSIDKDGNVTEERHAWYKPDPALRAEILAAWKVFDAELAAHVPAAPAAPPLTGKVREALPALVIEARGEITASNLDAYKVRALEVINGIPTDLSTDQQFADGKEDGKFCRDVQTAAEQAVKMILGRMGDVDVAVKALEHVAEVARRKAIDLENAVEAEEKRRKQAMVTDAAKALKDHIDSHNAKLGQPYMPAFSLQAALAQFSAAIKGKRSLPLMEDALRTTLANLKAAADQMAERIAGNMQSLVEASDKAQFPDAATLVLKAPDDLKAAIALRISEAEKLRAPAPAPDPVEAAPPMAPAPSVVQMPVRAATPAPDPLAKPTLKLGAICERLGFNVTAEFLRSLGFEPAGRDRAAVLYHEAKFPLICAALVSHIEAIQAKAAA